MRATPLGLRLVLLLIFLGIAAALSRHVGFDDSLQRWVPRDFGMVEEYESFLADFRSDALVIVSLVDSHRPGRETPPPIIDTLIGRIASLEHVTGARRWPPPFLRSKVEQADSVHSLFFTFSPPSHLNPHRPELLIQLDSLLTSTGLQFRLAGTGVIHEAINEETREAAQRFLGAGFLVLVGFLFILLRSVSAILRILGISLGGVGVVIVSAYLFQIDFTLVISILPVLVLFYGTSASLHALNQRGSFKKVAWPTLIAVLTTCAGFSVFLLDPIPLLRDFGLLAISGLLGGFFWAAFLFFPGAGDLEAFGPLRGKVGWARNLWTTRSVAAGVGFFLICLPGALRINAEIDMLSVIPEGNQSLEDYNFIEQNVGLYMPIEYRLPLREFDREDVRDWIERAFALEKVGAVMSYLAIPPWLDGRELGYVSQDGGSGRITFLIPVMSTTEGVALVAQIDELALEVFPDMESPPQATGFTSLFVSVVDVLATSFKRGLLLAFLVVFSILFLFLRNPRLFLASLLPNLIPIVAILGIMGWFGIPLDMVTVPICCLALGIIVDDSIHLLHWYKKTGDEHSALTEAGPGIVLTSIVMTAGFSVFLFSSVPPARNLGLLSITAMVTALFSDLVILPVLIRWIMKTKGKPAEDPYA
jgi:predicted RND superfamily exporter protein